MRASDQVRGGSGLLAGLISLLTGATVVGWIFQSIDTDTGLARWDRAAAEFGRDNATETSTAILDVITSAGGTPYLVVVLTAVGIADFLRRRNPEVVAYLVVVGGGVSLLNNGLKWIVGRERPEVGVFIDTAGTSFPSGHSAAAAACWAAVALVLGRHVSHRGRVALGATAALIAIAVAVTRVLLGAHWLTDVVAGLAVGWTWFAIVTLAFAGRRQHLGRLDAERLPDPHDDDVRDVVQV